ncbi:hypothetical protein K438DRAFT_2028907 [Mycena galopus ATCC 62051]|nr:hypothetical protein K438DRAFT_2028907 [Mycena galopus ATCC 62051]
MDPTHTDERQTSIIKRLPNEILSEVMSHSFISDLVRICKTCRLLRIIAMPHLYRIVLLETNAQVMAFIVTALSSAVSADPLALRVREFSIKDRGLLNPTHLRNGITCVVLQLSLLEYLSIMVREPIEFAHVLEYAYFPNLTTFRYIVKSPTTTPLVLDFLRRHPKITFLTLGRDAARNSEDWDVAQISPGHGLPPFLSFILQKPGLSTTLESPLLRLGPTKITVLVLSDSFSVSSFLAVVAAYVPHTRIVEVVQLESNAFVSRQEASKVAIHLGNMVSLCTLWLRAEYEDEISTWEGDDQETVALWSAACKSLSSVQIHDREWNYIHERWESKPIPPIDY